MAEDTEIFQLDKSNYPTREVIKVIGVGGAGNNALNHIIRGGVSGVEFIAANTDQAHLELSEAQTRIILGKELTKGLGAGSDPDVGCKAAQESRDEIRAAVEGADMVFLAAGMGGGTGTGAAPIIAGIAREAGALVVSVVTLPFSFEGRRRAQQANSGIVQLRDKVDALIVIPNDKLLSISDKKTSVNDAFGIADAVLHQAVQGVTDLILRPGIVNVDFADVKTIMSNAGPAIMGIGEGYGENRAATAAYNAINSPLMDTKMNGAKGILINITGSNVRIHEVNEATRIITEAADEDAYIIWGHVFDPDMEDSIQITVIATGFNDGSAATIPQKAAAATVLQHQSRPSNDLNISAVKNLNQFTAERQKAQGTLQQPQPVVKKEEPRFRTETKETLREMKSATLPEAKPLEAIKKITAEPQPAPQDSVSVPHPVRGSMTQPADTEDDLFSSSGAPIDQYDAPAFLRRKDKE
jgi:cell division protein FtsZ